MFGGDEFMAFDGIVTKSIVSELQKIIGSKIDKIHEPDRNTIILGLYFQGKNYALNICIDAHNCRLNLTTHSKTNPLVAPNFCMLLRKHLIGGRILDISMQGLERVVNIQIETINEFNEIEVKTLIIELMGKHSNIILTKSNGMIIDAMRHISSANSYREILPSRIYTLPKSDKYDFTELKDFEEFYDKLIGKQEEIKIEELSKRIANKFTGISLQSAKAVVSKCNIESVSKENLEKVYRYIQSIIKDNQHLKFETIYKNDKISDYVLVKDENSENHSLNFYIDDFYFVLQKELSLIFQSQTRMMHICKL